MVTGKTIATKRLLRNVYNINYDKTIAAKTIGFCNKKMVVDNDLSTIYNDKNGAKIISFCNDIVVANELKYIL